MMTQLNTITQCLTTIEDRMRNMETEMTAMKSELAKINIVDESIKGDVMHMKVDLAGMRDLD